MMLRSLSRSWLFAFRVRQQEAKSAKKVTGNFERDTELARRHADIH